jgi:hypothetical protein
MVALDSAVFVDRAAGQAAAAADPAVAMLTAPATAMMVSLSRFQKMIRSRDKMTLRLVAPLMNHAARDFLHPRCPPPRSWAGRLRLVDMARVRAPGPRPAAITRAGR